MLPHRFQVAHSLVVLLAGGLCSAQHPGGRHGSLDFQTAIRLVLRASQTGFGDLKGSKVEMSRGKSSWYEANLYLPGAKYCWVDYAIEAYHCDWEPSSSLETANEVHSHLVKQLSRALGEGWEATTQDDRGKSTRFSKQGDHKRATVTVSAPGKGAGHWVRLSVVSPGATPAHRQNR